jgi:hypothetical protein
MKIRARAALVVMACLVGLTGCVKVDADLEVNSNETVSGTMRLGIDKQLVQAGGQPLGKIREQVESGIKQTATEGVECEAFDDDKFVGSNCTLDEVPFDRIGTSTGEGIGIKKEGDQFVATVKAPDLGDIPSNAQPDVKFKITMPGKIISHDPGAEVSGRTATYDSLDELGNVSLRSEAGGGFPLWAIILIVVVLLVAIGAVLFLLLRDRKSRVQPFPGGPYPQGQWGPQYGGPQPMQQGPSMQQGPPVQYGPPGQHLQYGQPAPGPYPGGQPGPYPPPGQQGPGQPGQWGQPSPQPRPPQGPSQGPPQGGWVQPPDDEGQQRSNQPPQQGGEDQPPQGPGGRRPEQS